MSKITVNKEKNADKAEMTLIKRFEAEFSIGDMENSHESSSQASARDILLARKLRHDIRNTITESECVYVCQERYLVNEKVYSIYHDFTSKFMRWAFNSIKEPSVWITYGFYNDVQNLDEVSSLIEDMILHLDAETYFSKEEVELGLMSAKVINDTLEYLAIINELKAEKDKSNTMKEVA